MAFDIVQHMEMVLEIEKYYFIIENTFDDRDDWVNFINDKISEYPNYK